MIGAAAGVIHIQGIVVVVLFCVAMYLISQLYISKVLQANEEDFPNMELLMEGAGNSFGIFLLSWIVSFSFF